MVLALGVGLELLMTYALADWIEGKPEGEVGIKECCFLLPSALRSALVRSGLHLH